jgi:septum formation protein
VKLILASSSPYRRELLARLKIPFTALSPDIDESARPNETPPQLVGRLAAEKARKIATAHPDALVIGSDQVAVYDGVVVGKPRDHAEAMIQLKRASGKSVVLYTGLVLLNAKTGGMQAEVIPYHIQFRSLSDAQIDNYLRAEQPYNCAGSVKSEGLGIALLEKFEGDDPNTLIGLPLIRLVAMLEQEGVRVI